MIQRDSEILSDVLVEQQEELILADTEELKLWATGYDLSKKSVKPSGSYQTGQFRTIYQEPLLSFNIKRYGQGDLILAFKSNQDQFLVVRYNEKIKVFKNNQPIGTIRGNNNVLQLYDNKDSLKVEMVENGNHIQIKNRNKSLAFINKRNLNGQFDTERLFSLYHDFDIEDSEDDILILSAYYLIANG